MNTGNVLVLPSLLQSGFKQRMHPASMKMVWYLCGYVSLLVWGGGSLGYGLLSL